MSLIQVQITEGLFKAPQKQDIVTCSL